MDSSTDQHCVVSGNLVPVTVYKGAGYEHIPFSNGAPHITADFHSIRTQTDAPAYITSGFYKTEAGPLFFAHYAFEEAKYVLSGQIDVYVRQFQLQPRNSA